MNYRRSRHAGGTYFFTVNIADRKQDLLVTHIEVLRSAFRLVKQRHPFHIDAIVVLPDHLHAVWTLPKGDAEFAKRWRLIKSSFSLALPQGERISKSRYKKGERGIWQRRYWEHMIRDDNDYRAHIDYIHYNPVKHGYVERCRDWSYSSFHHYVNEALLPADWGEGIIFNPADRFGE